MVFQYVAALRCLSGEILVGSIAYGLVLLFFHRNSLRGILQFAKAVPRRMSTRVLG